MDKSGCFKAGLVGEIEDDSYDPIVFTLGIHFTEQHINYNNMGIFKARVIRHLLGKYALPSGELVMSNLS